MRITVDLAKASTEPVDLTNALNPRVGDGNLTLPFHIMYDKDNYDMRGKSMDFLSEGSDKKKIYVSGTMTDDTTKGDDPYTGNVTFTFPEGTFKSAGTYDVDKTMFRIVNDADHSVISTVNVKLNVLPNNSDVDSADDISYDSRMEKVVKDFTDEGQSALDDAKKASQQAADDAKKEAADYLADVKKQGDELLDEIKQTNAEAKGNVAGDTAATATQAKQLANDNSSKIHDLQDEVGDARGRFMTLSDRENKQDFNIDRKEEKANANANYAAINLRDDQQDIAIASKASQHFITDYLSHLNLNPTAYRSLDELTQKYPDGDERLAIVSNKENTFFAYWDPSTKVWTQGANLVDPDKIHFDEILESFHNYIPNPSFNGIEMPGTSGTVTQKIIKKDNQNWLHFETTGIGGIYWLIDPAQESDSYFPKANKQFSLVIVNNDTKPHVITADIHITNADTSDAKDTVILPGVSIEAFPGKPTIIEGRYPVAGAKPFIDNNYQMFVYDQTGNGSFDVKDPKLMDYYQENTTDFDGLVSSKSIAEPLKGSSLEQISYMNQEMYHLKLDDTNNTISNDGGQKECGLRWHFRLSDTAYVDQTPLFLGLSLINRNSYNAQKVTVSYQELNDDGSVDFNFPVGSYVMLPNGSITINKSFHFGLNKVHNEGQLVITADNPKEVELYVSADAVLRHSFSKIESNNLFGDFLSMGRGVWGGSSVTDNYGGQQSLKTVFDGTNAYPSILLPIINPSKGATYKASLTFASDDDLTLYFNVKNFDSELGVLGKLANLGTGTMHIKAGQIKKFTGTYTADDLEGLFQGLQIFTIGQSGTIYLLDAKLQLLADEDSAESGGTNVTPSTNQSSGNVLPIINLKTEFINGGSSLSKGKVTFTRDNHTEEYFATFRIQGNSSTLYPKKSWRITFYEDDTYKVKKEVNVFPDYAPVNAINMKANWIDWTQANNLLISRYVSELSLLTASDLAKEQVEAWSQGQITGEPVLGFNNDKPLGLFTISPKKSNTMFNMNKKSTTQAVFQGGVYSNATEFKADYAEFTEAKDFSIEGPDDDVAQPLKDSFNALLKLTNSGTDDEFKAQISSKINLRSIANWIVMTMLFGIEDEAAKNIMFATWDGQKWNAMQYDHDLAMGIDFQAQSLQTSANSINLNGFMAKNKLVQRLIQLHIIDNMLIDSFDKFASTHSFLDLQKDYRDYMYHVGSVNYDNNEKLWPDMPGRKYFRADHVMTYLRERYADCKNWFTTDYLSKL